MGKRSEDESQGGQGKAGRIKREVRKNCHRAAFSLVAAERISSAISKNATKWTKSATKRP
jgi:hypothetical protein